MGGIRDDVKYPALVQKCKFLKIKIHFLYTNKELSSGSGSGGEGRYFEELGGDVVYERRICFLNKKKTI